MSVVCLALIRRSRHLNDFCKNRDPGKFMYTSWFRRMSLGPHGANPYTVVSLRWRTKSSQIMGQTSPCIACLSALRVKGHYDCLRQGCCVQSNLVCQGWSDPVFSGKGNRQLIKLVCWTSGDKSFCARRQTESATIF